MSFSPPKAHRKRETENKFRYITDFLPRSKKEVKGAKPACQTSSHEKTHKLSSSKTPQMKGNKNSMALIQFQQLSEVIVKEKLKICKNRGTKAIVKSMSREYQKAFQKVIQDQTSQKKNKSEFQMKKNCLAKTGKNSHALADLGESRKPKQNILQQIQNKPQVSKLQLQEVKQSIKDYHEEFMEHMEEFSLSWREQLLKENQKFSK